MLKHDRNMQVLQIEKKIYHLCILLVFISKCNNFEIPVDTSIWYGEQIPLVVLSPTASLLG